MVEKVSFVAKSWEAPLDFDKYQSTEGERGGGGGGVGDSLLPQRERKKKKEADRGRRKKPEKRRKIGEEAPPQRPISSNPVPEASSIHLDFGLFEPYFDLPLLRFGIPSKSKSSAPRIRWDFTPGESFTLPPLINTLGCSCKLWPSPGMWANISCWLLNRTLAILRGAELGFFGVLVETRGRTPRFWGHWSEARVRSVRRFSSLPWRINWFNVGIAFFFILPPIFALSLVVTPDPKHPFSIHREIQSLKSIKRPSWTKIQTDQSCWEILPKERKRSLPDQK